MNYLAVVLISKDQEWNISRLITSVLAEISNIELIEVVLVDSDSTDDTINIACKYPINVIQLQPDQRLTAAAGRYIGYNNTASEFILFLDGDMELFYGWLEKALLIIENEPDVAAITGQVIDLPRSRQSFDKCKVDIPTFRDSAAEVLHGGGAAIYRRSVLEQVGTFNPHIYSDEEPELCIRIRHAGYRILRLKYPVAYHYSDPPDNFSTLVARWRRNLYVGYGQSIRYHLGSKLLWPYLKERGHALFPGLGLLAGFISFLWSLISFQWHWFGLWILFFGLIIFIDAYRKHSLYLTISSLLKRLLIIHGTVVGFFKKPLNPNTCPIRFDLIKFGVENDFSIYNQYSRDLSRVK